MRDNRRVLPNRGYRERSLARRRARRETGLEFWILSSEMRRGHKKAGRYSPADLLREGVTQNPKIPNLIPLGRCAHFTVIVPFMPAMPCAGKLQTKGYTPAAVSLKVTSSDLRGPSSAVWAMIWSFSASGM